MIENFNAIVKPKSYLKSRLMTHTQIWKWNEKIQRCVHKSNDTHASNRSRFLVKWIAIVNVWYKLARVPTLFQLCRLWLCHCVHGRSFSVVPPPFHFIAFCHCLVDEMKKKKKRMWFAFQITRSAFAAHLPVYNEVLYIGTLPFFFSIRRRLRTFVYTLCAPLFYGEKDHVLLCNLESPLSARAGAAFHPFIWHPIVCVHVFLLTPKSWQVKC